MTNAVFRDNGIPKTRQIYHMKSAAVTDLKKVRIDSTTNTPYPNIKNSFILFKFLCLHYERRINWLV